MKWSIGLFIIFLWTSPQAKIYIDIDQSSSRAFPIAIVTPTVKNTQDKDLAEVSEVFIDTLRRDLRVMGVFDVISPKGFIEPQKEAGLLKASEINFDHWKKIEAQGLVKGEIKNVADTFVIEMYLHDVTLQKQLTAKRYVGKKDQAREMAHRFGNAVVHALIGEQGVFDTQIAFICNPKGKKELCMMSFNGWNYRKITDYKNIVLSPAWDPLTNSIYFTAFNKKEKPQLYLYQIDRKKILSLTSLPGMVIGLSFDPVSKNIISALTKDGNSEIYLLNRYGDAIKRLTNHRKIDVSASYSPDGKEMVFVSDRDGSEQVYKMNLESQKVTRLTFKGTNNASPAWSPKGDKIAFSGMDTDRKVDIFVMNTDGSNLKRLTYDTGHNEDPTWAPDGNFIAFTSNRTGKSQIYMMRPNGKMQTQLTFKPWDHFMPAWERK
ncbi:MAG: Tol-Pal system beta propeller repeat protein TolB [Deltaproteobacteria bacterium]|nr:Tol-Pal system beta propeller repeat protein TolB [Deltaproteobacteria bacterium]